MIEALVLGILEGVIGRYISDVIARKREVQTRAEVIAIVQEELRPRLRPEEQAEALPIAVRELDVLVKQDPHLRWRDERLTPVVRRGVRGRPSYEDLVDELRRAVLARREELGLPLDAKDLPAPLPSDIVDPAPAEPPPDEPRHEVESPFVPAETASAPQTESLAERALNLRRDVAEERRRREP